MLKVFIDEVGVNLPRGQKLRFTIDCTRMTSLSYAGRRVEVTLPAAGAAGRAIGGADDARAREKFNNSLHEGRIEQDGCVLLRGRVWLLEVKRKGRVSVSYRVAIEEQRPGWIAQAADNDLKRVPLQFSETMNGETIRRSWTWDKPVRFLPVQRSEKPEENAVGNIIPPQRVLTADDYHPFLHVGSMLQAIITGAGYRMVSSFATGRLFDSLYMSGRYTEMNTTAIEARYGFYASRFDDISAAANSYGKVVADPNIAVCSVGNIVDTADPAAVRGGLASAGVFNTGNVLRTVGNRVAFVPAAPVQVGFEFGLRYSTTYRILSRGELSGFNSVSLCDGVEQSYMLANNFADRRMSLEAGHGYTALIFNHPAGCSYQLRYDKVVNPSADMDNLKPSDVQNITLATFSARSYGAALPSGNRAANIALWEKPTGATSYTLSSRDWALYEGWVAETGTTEVEVTLRSEPQLVTPSSPQYFDDIYFGGAPAGFVLKLHKSTYVKPYFRTGPASSSKLSVADIAAYDAKQIDLIEALAQMFNLRFLTVEHLKEVHIEPYDKFFGTFQAVDWTALTDTSQPFTIVEPGEGMHRTTIFGYHDGDGAVTAYNAAGGCHAGEWSYTMGSLLAASRKQTLLNALFAPTVSQAGGLSNAPEAYLMQTYSLSQDSLNFSPRIVRYAGMEPLGAGRMWGWPSYGNSYPLAAFLFHGTGNVFSGASANPLSSPLIDSAQPAVNGFSLCFENREGVAGLNCFRLGEVQALDKGRRITLWVRLGAADMEQLLFPSLTGRDMRAVFIVFAGGEELRCRLERVDDYDPEGFSVKCTFLTI